MKKSLLYTLTILTISNIFAQEQTGLKPATGIDSAFCYFDSTGAHLRAELSTDDIKYIEAAAIRIVEEFNNNVAMLWRPWTQEEIQKYTPREREEYKNKIEASTWKLFIADANEYFTHESSNYKVYKSKGVYYYQNQYGQQKRAYNPQRDEYGVLRQTVEEDIKHLPARIEITSKYRKGSTMRAVRKYLNNIKNNRTYSQVVFSAGGITVSNKLRMDAEGRYVGTISYYQDFSGTRPDGSSYTDKTHRSITYYVYINVQPTSDGEDMVVWSIKLGDIRATATE